MDSEIVFARAAAPAQSRLRLEICIPVFRQDPSNLIADLSRQIGAGDVALRLYDDGSGDPVLTQRIREALAAFPGQSTLMSIAENRGRAGARNGLINAAEGEWLLFLDADMRVEGRNFLNAYLEAAARQNGPCCIVGGFGVDLRMVTSATKLHAMQSHKSECLDAARRNADPGRYVFTSNIFLHRQICKEMPFNDQFRGWGWEDVEWGLNIVSRFPVIHIDNAATHLGLDEDKALLGKYERSGLNFLLMLQAHPDSVARMPVYRIARHLSHLPLRRALIWSCRQTVVSGRSILPVSLRLYALKVFRAAIYAQALHAQKH